MASKPEVRHLDEAPAIERCESALSPKVAMIPKSGVDDALQMALDSQEETWTAEEERQILWKIDLVLVPLVCGALFGNCGVFRSRLDMDMN